MISSLAAKGKILPLSAVINSLKRSRSLQRRAANQPLPRQDRGGLAACAWLSRACHLLLDRSRDASEGPREIPVEVVTATPPPPAPKPAAPQAGEKSKAPHEATQAPTSLTNSRRRQQIPSPRMRPCLGRIPQKNLPRRKSQDPRAKSAAPQKSAKGGSSATSKPTHKDTAKNEIAQEHPPAAKPEGGPARQDGGSENGGRRNPA